MSPGTRRVKGDVRAFVALELAAEMKSALQEFIQKLEPRLPGVRWVRPNAMHLTLRFLGASRAEQLAQIRPRLEEAAGECPACLAPVGGLGTFPASGSPRVLWIGIQLPQSIFGLQAACEQAAVAAGFVAERRPFRAHLTLGRWRGRAALPLLPETDLGAVELSELVLYQSDLRPEGAAYTPLGRFGLRGARGTMATQAEPSPAPAAAPGSEGMSYRVPGSAIAVAFERRCIPPDCVARRLPVHDTRCRGDAHRVARTPVVAARLAALDFAAHEARALSCGRLDVLVASPYLRTRALDSPRSRDGDSR